MRIKIFGFALAAVFLLTSATNWDGAATIDPGGDLPPEGYCIATNAFPINSVVDVTNLENHKTVRVIVFSGLHSSGLLATLSHDAAEILGFQDNFVYRIRMTQPSDVIAFSFLQQQGITASEPSADRVIANIANENLHDSSPEDAESKPETPGFALWDNETEDEEINYEPEEPEVIILQNSETENGQGSSSPEKASESVASTMRDSPPEPTAAERAIVSEDPSLENTDAKLSLIPSEERIPEGPEYLIGPDNIVPPIEPFTPVEQEKEYSFISGIQDQNPSVSESSPWPDFAPFQVCIINELERGRWYIQVAAYSQLNLAEDEINRIGTAYPLAIQRVDTDTNSFFRLLLGPLLNQGESAAMLQRIKTIGYKDAFVRTR